MAESRLSKQLIKTIDTARKARPTPTIDKAGLPRYLNAELMAEEQGSKIVQIRVPMEFFEAFDRHVFRVTGTCRGKHRWILGALINQMLEDIAQEEKRQALPVYQD